MWLVDHTNTRSQTRSEQSSEAFLSRQSRGGQLSRGPPREGPEEGAESEGGVAQNLAGVGRTRIGFGREHREHRHCRCRAHSGRLETSHLGVTTATHARGTRRLPNPSFAVPHLVTFVATLRTARRIPHPFTDPLLRICVFRSRFAAIKLVPACTQNAVRAAPERCARGSRATPSRTSYERGTSA